MADYLEAALEDGDPKVVAAVLEDIARAKVILESERKTKSEDEDGHSSPQN